MKIGILTFHCAKNIGAQLQAFALLYTLLNLGYDAEFIRYEPSYLKKPYSLCRRMNFKAGFGAFLKQFVFFVIWDAFSWCRTSLHFRSFQKRYFKLSAKKFSTVADLENSNYDALIVGSDQIWNSELTGNRLDDFYTLNFANNIRKKKVSYAGSLSLEKLNSLEKTELMKRLCSFDSISVREKEVSCFFSKCGQKNNLVLDPTLLLKKEEWLCFIGEKRLVKEKYVLIYQARGNRDAVYKYAKEKAKQLNARIIDASGMNYRVIKGGKQFVNPLEFLNLIFYAEYVITLSFHGTALSIILEKPFVSILLDDGRDNRVLNLLKIAGMEKCAKKINDLTLAHSEGADTTSLVQLRDESLKFLNDALKEK